MSRTIPHNERSPTGDGLTTFPPPVLHYPSDYIPTKDAGVEVPRYRDDVEPQSQAGSNTLREADPEADAFTSNSHRVSSEAPKVAEQEETSRRPDELQDQSSRLPFRKLIVVYAGLMICLFMSFLDQTSVYTVLPAIAHDLGAADKINWVGISFLVATSSSQIIIARLSDIFGRKPTLMCVIMLFTFGNLLCGFAQNAIWLFIARAISGVGGGGINSMCMIIVSDIVSLRQRGKYQGFLGAAVATGSGIGPLIGGSFAAISWRWIFWFTVPISLLCAAELWWLLPLLPVKGNFKEKLKKVDFVGSGLSLVAVVLLLVPISGGGIYYAWGSPMVIAMIVLGTMFAIVFVLVEWRIAVIPILPLRLFHNGNVLIIYVTTVLAGIVFYANLYFLPSYYTDARGWTSIQSGVFLLPLVLLQTATSSTCGQILSRTGRFKPCIVVGFSVWCIAAGLQSTFGLNTSKGRLVGTLMLEGFGIGGTLQTTLVAAQASVRKEDRAVVTGARMFFRTLGGAVGLVACTTVKNNVLRKKLSELSSTLSPALAAQVIKSGPAVLASFGIQPGDPLWNDVHNAYMGALHAVFILVVPIAGVCAIMTCFLKEVELPGDKKPEEKPQQGVEDIPMDMKNREEVPEESLETDEKKPHEEV